MNESLHPDHGRREPLLANQSLSSKEQKCDRGQEIGEKDKLMIEHRQMTLELR